MPSIFELHLRCQALGYSRTARRRSEQRRLAVAAEVSRQRAARLRDLLRELREAHRLWR